MEGEKQKQNPPGWWKPVGLVLIPAVCLAAVWSWKMVSGKQETANASDQPIQEQLLSVEAVEAAFVEEFMAAGKGMERSEEEETGISEENTGDMTADMPVENIPAGQETGDPLQDTSGNSQNLAVDLADIYTESGKEAVFRCYQPEAEMYSWEIYSLEEKGWQSAEESMTGMMTDETGRQVSVFRIPGERKYHETMVRCTIRRREMEEVELEEEIQEASLYILEKKITGIDAEDYECGVPACIDAGEIPVCVTYEDGSQETVTGLNGLRFAEKEEHVQAEKDEAGNQIHTTTTVVKEKTCSYMEIGEKEVMLRYVGNGEMVMESSCKLTGTDRTSPEISGVELSPYQVSREDQPVPVTVTIRAEDGHTPYPLLMYAFVPEGKEPGEGDWGKKSSFEKTITENGTWTAYVRDEAGNTASSGVEILAVDQNAPELSIKLEEEDWCESTRILVQAEDISTVTYRFVCKESGEDSGWTESGEYDVSSNGIWIIEAKDEAGNVSSQELEISKIDHTPPVIHNITTKE